MGLFHQSNKSGEKKLDVQKAFELNLKYISRQEMNVEDIKKQFVKSNTRFYLTVGEIDWLSGRIIVYDPLVYLVSGKFFVILETEIPIGKYPVEVSICRSNEIGIRMCTARLKIKNTSAVKYVIANPIEESAAFIAKDGILSGFPVDAGMISFCDEQVAKEYQAFLDTWYQDNPDGNHYDDYFAPFFKESAVKLPQYQGEDGDFIVWENPNTKHKLVMIASGLGDGFYQSYWGYDAQNEICEMIVPLVNPDLFGV